MQAHTHSPFTSTAFVFVDAAVREQTTYFCVACLDRPCYMKMWIVGKKFIYASEVDKCISETRLKVECRRASSDHSTLIHSNSTFFIAPLQHSPTNSPFMYNCR